MRPGIALAGARGKGDEETRTFITQTYERAEAFLFGRRSYERPRSPPRWELVGSRVESKEYLAGVWVWEAPDLDVALKLAAEASKVCDRKIEVRPFL
jgi:hypothetical protein